MLPLADVRILAVEQFGAGPWGTLQLADLGAEVIKIEDPAAGGDVGRYVPPFQEGEHSLFFETFNRNKKSLSLDLRHPDARGVFEDLVRVSDVVYSNLRGDQPKRLRLTYDDLKTVNPRIVCCSLSGFGMTGPRASEGGYDYMMQGLAGLDEPHRRSRGPADEERPLARRPLRRVCVGDRGARGAVARAPRRCRLRLRRFAPRHRAPRADVRRHVGGVARLHAAEAPQLGSSVDRPVPDLPDRRRLDRRRLPEAEVLGGALRCDRQAGARERSAIRRLRRARPKPRRARADPRGGVPRARRPRSGLPCFARPACRPRRSTTCRRRSRRRGSWSTSIPQLGTVRQVASPLRLSGAEPPVRPAPTRGEHTEAVLVELCGYSPERVRRARRTPAYSVRRRKERQMPRQALQPDGMATPKPPYSPVVISGDLVYTAGQVAHDADGSLVGGRHRGADEADARERPHVSRGGGVHARRRAEGERVPRRPRRLRRLQPRLPRVLRRAVSRAHERPGRACPPACSSRSRPSPAGAHDAATSSATASTRPTRSWPGGARLALSFVLNYEEGGERTPLEGDPESEAYLHEVVGAPPTVGRRNLNTESMFEFGSRAGFWRVHRIFREHDLPLTVYAVGQALEGNPAAARAMADAGWEVASHGWRWIDYLDVSEEDERADMRHAIETIERACGQRPVGWYTGRVSAATRRARRRGGRLPLRLRLVRRRASLLGRGGRAPAPRHPVHARCERLQVPHPQRLRHRLGLPRLPRRLVRAAVRGRRQDDVGRASLPNRRPAWTR